MKKLLAVVCLLAPSLMAEGLPSSKATAQINTLVKCHMSAVSVNDLAGAALIPASCVNLYDGATVATKNQWIKIMSKPMKLSNSQSVFLSPSLVTGLYTRTRTKTTTGSTSTAVAQGAVYLRAVMVPVGGGAEIVAAPISACRPNPANPTGTNIFGCAQPESGKWGVTLESRLQSLTQELSACVIDVTVIPGTNDGTCTFTSTIDLLLQTTSANTFNFIFPSVGQGVYNVEVWAAVGSDASLVSGSSGTAVGAAAFGLGSMLAESVRLVHDFEF